MKRGSGSALVTLALLLIISVFFLRDKLSTSDNPQTASVADTLNQGLVAHWKLDELTGTTVADSSGNSYTGTKQSVQGTAPSSREGKIGRSMWFDGSDDSITAPRVLTTGTNVSIATWVFVPSWTERGSFIKIGGSNGIALGIGSGNFSTAGNSLLGLYEGRRWLIPNKDISPGGWHHVAMTVDSLGTARFYVDGGTPAVVPGEAPLAPTGSTAIGGHAYDNSPRYFKGQLDDLRVYNRVLSDAEIAFLATGATPNSSTPNTGVANSAPVALPAAALTLEATPITVTLNATDAQNDSLIVSVVTQPSRGSLSNYKKLSNTQFQFTYWPVNGFAGTDTFSYRFSDGLLISNTAQATITVNTPGVNAPTTPTSPTTPTTPTVPTTPTTPVQVTNNVPTVSDSNAFTYVYTPITVTINASDRDAGDNLSLTIKQSPSHGLLSNFAKVNNSTFRYTYWPVRDYVGADTFTYDIFDGKAYSNVGRASIQVAQFGQPTVVQPPTTPTVPTTPTTPVTVTPPTTPTSVATDSYPPSVHLFKHAVNAREYADRNMSLQTALDTYRSVRLEAADYSTISGPITIRSGYKLYGLPGTKTPKIIVEPGTRNALVSRVSAGTLSFPSSQAVTSNNVFSFFMYTSIEIDNARLENNLFLDFNYSQITSNTTGHGYLRNNRFVRFRAHGVSPQVVLRGDAARSSYGNVFVGFNFLTPGGATTDISNQRDITFVGGDAETWNFNRTSSDALIKVRSSGRLSVLGLQGGGGQSGIYDVAADDISIVGSYISTNTGTDINIPAASRVLLVNHDQRTVSDTSRIGQVFRAQEDNFGDEPRYNGSVVQNSLSSTGQTALRSMLTSAQGVVWEQPSYEVVPDPLGASWNNGLYSRPDSTQYLQSRINSNQIIPPGTYYISSPLQVGSNNILWGSGEASTIIVAKSRIDMVVSSAHRDTEAANGFKVVVGDLTLQGGRNGISLDASGAGRYAQLTDAVISHVTMRNMENAGLNVNAIYAIDNVLFDNIKVVNSGTGIKQTPESCRGGDNPGIAYIDKMNIYRGQFINNQLGFDFPACRPNNANVCIECFFKDNAVAAVRMESNNLPVFVNSDFVNNGGSLTQPTISNKNNTGNWGNNIVVVGSRFSPGNATALLGAHRIDVEGSRFERGSNASARIVAGGVKASFYNVNSSIDAGTVQNGISLNSLFPSGIFRNIAVSVRNGVHTILIPGVATPETQYLRGSRF